MTKTSTTALLGLFFALTGCMTGEPDTTDDIDEDDTEVVEDSDATDEVPLPEDEILETAATVPKLIDSDEVGFVNKLNALRKSKGLPPMRVSIGLTRAANVQLKRIQAANKIFPASASLIDTYYPYDTAIAQNAIELCQCPGPNPGPYEKWKAAGGTKLANMLSNKHTVVGIARGLADFGTPSSYYWVVIYGGYKDAILSAGTTTIASNGSFETDPKVDPATGESTVGVNYNAVRKTNRWYFWSTNKGADSFTFVAGDPVSDVFAGEVALTVIDGKDAISVTQMVKAAPGVNYRVTARTLDDFGNRPSPQYLYLEFVNKDFKRLGVKRVEAGQQADPTWKLLSVQEVSPPGTAFARTFIYGSPDAGMESGHVWDDIRVTAF